MANPSPNDHAPNQFRDLEAEAERRWSESHAAYRLVERDDASPPGSFALARFRCLSRGLEPAESIERIDSGDPVDQWTWFAQCCGYALRLADEERAPSLPQPESVAVAWPCDGNVGQQGDVLLHGAQELASGPEFFRIFPGEPELWHTITSVVGRDPALGELTDDVAEHMMRFGYALRACERVVGLRIGFTPAEVYEQALRIATGVAEIQAQCNAALVESVLAAQRGALFQLLGEERSRIAAPEAHTLAFSAANAGYVMRVVEEQRCNVPPRDASSATMLEQARAHESWVGIEWWGIVNEISVRAAAELSPATNFSLPGVDDKVRLRVGDLIITQLLGSGEPPSGVTTVELHRCFVYGFLFRCFEMSLPPGAAI